ncbi:MAG: SpoIIE family protein phosphatase [Flavobacteriales bacterium]|nr:SpoIIE family protein phosphatase [Flavobacteriales bacterium]
MRLWKPKPPIGKVDNPFPFTTHVFELQKGDTIYVFTDGFVDQFGGENLPDGKPVEKKFKAKALRALLLSIQNEPMETQKELLTEAFNKWQGSLERVDDVCVIGVKY